MSGLARTTPGPRRTHRRVVTAGLLVAAGALALCAGCDHGAADAARAHIRTEHVPRLLALVRAFIPQSEHALEQVAVQIEPGFAVTDPRAKEAQMRDALRALGRPPRGIPALMTSPKTFVAAVGADGVVIARDRTPDAMHGQNFAERFTVVARALARGVTGHQLVEFGAADAAALPPAASTPAADTTDDATSPSVSLLFAAPVRRDAEIVGAAVMGVPLWRLAQRLSRQVRAEHVEAITKKGLALWVYLYRGDRVFRWGTPPELDAALPDADTRAAGLAKSPGGFTGALHLLGRPWGYGVVPLPILGPGVGMIVLRAEPM